jgi:hypothetical protein
MWQNITTAHGLQCSPEINNKFCAFFKYKFEPFEEHFWKVWWLGMQLFWGRGQ